MFSITYEMGVALFNPCPMTYDFFYFIKFIGPPTTPAPATTPATPGYTFCHELRFIVTITESIKHCSMMKFL